MTRGRHTHCALCTYRCHHGLWPASLFEVTDDGAGALSPLSQLLLGGSPERVAGDEEHLSACTAELSSQLAHLSRGGAKVVHMLSIHLTGILHLVSAYRKI